MGIKANVISVPARKTVSLIEATNIHSYPNRYRYKETPFITFRRKGSFMDSIFTIEDTVIINPNDKNQLQNVDEKHRKAIALYIEQRQKSFEFDKEDYRFYILSKKEDLPHQPFIVGYQKQCYFTLNELTKGHQDVRTTTILAALEENKKEE